jgi:hypothetical protein
MIHAAAILFIKQTPVERVVGNQNFVYLTNRYTNSRFYSLESAFLQQNTHRQGCIQMFPDWVDNEIYAYKNKHSLRSNTKVYGGKTH